MYLITSIIVLLGISTVSFASNLTTILPTTGLNTTAIPNIITHSNSTKNSSHVNSTASTIACVEPCSCYVNKYGKFTLKCQISQLAENWTMPIEFESLDLSSNDLTKVPSDFFKLHNMSVLVSLSLQRNALKIIEEDAFIGLESLQRLDLSFVQLQEWRGNISRSLPSLRYLDVTGNSPWLPSDNVFAVRSIRTIKGVTWSSNCFNCTLINIIHMNGTGGLMPPSGGGGPNGSMEQPSTSQGNMTGPAGTPPGRSPGPPSSTKGAENLALKFLKKNYFSVCSEVPDLSMCAPSYIENPNNDHFVLPSKLFYVAYALGSLAILLNFSIIFIYIYSTSMRKINSMLLISNMALCDILVGVYAIIIAKMNIFNVLLSKKTIEEKLHSNPFNLSKFCIVASVLFTVGQIVAVITALLLTVDKFLSIVYCMDPNRKLSRRLSFLLLIICWTGAFVYALTPLFPNSSGFLYSSTSLCTLPVREMKDIVISFGLLVALYIANIPFYGKIFLFVRRSSVRMGVRRDAVLAKKIALLVFTNFIFFAVPMIMMIVFIFVFKIHVKIETSRPQDSTAIIWRYVLCYWMPVICLCFNSCLNPFLCAYRQRQFRREVKKCARNCFLNHLCKAFTTFRSDSSVRTTQPTRVEMYKLSNIESQAP